MGQFKKRLAKAKGAWNKGKERGSFVDLPDGFYIVKLKSAKVAETDSGKMGLTFTYAVLDGEHEGQTLADWNNLEHEVGCSILMGKIAKMNVAVPDDIEDIEDTADELNEMKPRLRLRLKSRKSDDGRVFQDKRVDRFLGADGADDDDDDEYEVHTPDETDDDTHATPDDDNDDDGSDPSIGEQAEVGDQVNVEQGDEKWVGTVTEVRDDGLVVHDPDADEGEDMFEVEFDEVIGLKKAPKKSKGGRRRAAKPADDTPDPDDDHQQDDPAEAEDDDDEFDEVELSEGMTVNVDGMGECNIIKLDEKAGLVTVQPVGGGRKKRVSPDQVEVIPASAQSDDAPKRGKGRRPKK